MKNQPEGATMLKLESVSAEPFWLDVLPAVRIQFRPVSVAAMLIARDAAMARSLAAATRGKIARRLTTRATSPCRSGSSRASRSRKS
jgi:hypothetical protein